MPLVEANANPTLTLTIAAATLLAVAFGRLPGWSVSRAALATAGATLLILTGALSLERALEHVDGEVLVLLFGLMVVNAALSEAGAFRYMTDRLTRGALGPHRLLALVIGASGVLSALFLNDTVALALTPLVVRMTRRLGLPSLPYLLALALSVNAGSVATVTGNPQNVLVAVAADVSYGGFLTALGPVAAASLLMVYLVVATTFRRDLAVRPAPPIDRPATLPAPNRWGLLPPIAATVGMLVAFAAGADVALAALVAGAALLLVSGRRSVVLLRKIDYGLLVLFAALFAVVGAVTEVGLWQAALAGLMPVGGSTWSNVGATVGVTAALSTVVSNVPAVLMLLPAAGFGLEAHPGGSWLGTDVAAMTLAMASTLAGNLTLVASVANLIVAESARRLGVEVGFFPYLRVGLPVTLLTLALGTAWIAGFLVL